MTGGLVVPPVEPGWFPVCPIEMEGLNMVCIQQKTCCKCGTQFDGIVGGDDKCGACRSEYKDAAAKEHFDKLDAMTIEERLRRIEKWIYEYTPPVHPSDIVF